MSTRSKSRFRDQLKALGYRSYQEYLSSAHWADVRERFWNSGLWRGYCFCCQARYAQFDLHHKTYKRLGNERLTDLVGLCRECHRAAHQLEEDHSGVTLWNAVRRVRKLSAGSQMGQRKAHRPLAGPVRAVQPSSRR